MSADERQSYQNSLHRVSLRHDASNTSAALTGAYVTPLPPQLCNNIGSSISQSATAEHSVLCSITEFVLLAYCIAITSIPPV